MEKLELKHLAVYLPYQLMIMTDKGRAELTQINTENKVLIRFRHGYSLFTQEDGSFFKDFKPILRPLSDYMGINSDAMNHLNCDVSTQIQINELAIKYISVGDLHYSTVELCLKNHIDIFGLIDKELAVPLT